MLAGTVACREIWPRMVEASRGQHVPEPTMCDIAVCCGGLEGVAVLAGDLGIGACVEVWARVNESEECFHDTASPHTVR